MWSSLRRSAGSPDPWFTGKTPFLSLNAVCQANVLTDTWGCYLSPRSLAASLR